ncbi:MAG: hypothetical protein ABI583_07670 [Betaproteobacteria bacterium]
MSRLVEAFQQSQQPANVVGANGKHAGFAWRWLLAGLLTLVVPTIGHAESKTGTNSNSASVNFRIVIPAIIRVSAVSQPEHILIENRHIAQGYVDLDASTLVKITINTRSGYLLGAQYDAHFLTKVEVQMSGQNLIASTGAGSMRVDSGIIIDKLVPISYRLHLAPGVRAGDYRWPVALAFSLAAV